MPDHAHRGLSITGVDLNNGDEVIINLSDGTTLEITLEQLLSLHVVPTPAEEDD